ncbi:hypothetical protein ACH41H_40975 [Streptomyces sp. NPDC020800]
MGCADDALVSLVGHGLGQSAHLVALADVRAAAVDARRDLR